MAPPFWTSQQFAPTIVLDLRTYRAKFIELYQGLVKARLRDLKFIFLVSQSLFEVAISLAELRMSIIQGPCLVLDFSQSMPTPPHMQATNPQSLFKIRHFSVVFR